MSEEQLDELLGPIARRARVLVLEPNDEARDVRTDSKFGGAPYAEAGDEWPTCSGCDNDLVFVAQIRDDLSNVLVVFFYCFDCFPWGLSDEERGQWVVRRYESPDVDRAANLEPRNEMALAVRPCTVTKHVVRALPDWESLESHSADASQLCSELNAESPWETYNSAVARNECLTDFATVLGGYPRWVQGQATAVCPECNEHMHFIVQIDSEDGAELMWGDVGLVYLFQCRAHPEIFHLELQCH